MALAMQRWGLHERLALSVISMVGSRPDRLVLGFMLATAGLSMWISNTATVVMMLPIALERGRARPSCQQPDRGANAVGTEFAEQRFCSLSAPGTGVQRLDRRHGDP